MGTGIPEYFAHKKYNICSEDITRLVLSCEPEDIQEKVILTPIWSKEDFLSEAVDSIETITERNFAPCVYTLSYQDQLISLVRSGIGAPQAGDAVLSLGCTPCRHLIFTGSFGGLTGDLAIGDLLTITESIGGDGYSSYLKEGELSPHAFLKPAKPDAALNGLLEEHAASIATESSAVLHKGRIFSSDTIVSQFFHLDEIAVKHGCAGIEMETSAVFNCSQLTGIAATALLLVSDVIPTNKSLFSGRTEEDRARYRSVKQSVLGRIILDTLCDERLDGTT
jgi:purine-nucleoside phosphorylase